MSVEPVATHCPYCALQCGVHMADGPDDLTVSGNAAFPVNKGGLCVKGWTTPETLDHPDRLRTPLVRKAEGELEPVSWEEALDLIVRRIGELQARHGPNAIGVFGG